MMTRKWFQTGIAAVLLVSGAMVARAAHADNCPLSTCPNGQPYNVRTYADFAWGTTKTLQSPPCGNCFGSIWAQYSSSGSYMYVNLTQASGFAGDCAAVSAFDRNGNFLDLAEDMTADGNSVGQTVSGTPAIMRTAGLVCQYPQ